MVGERRPEQDVEVSYHSVDQGDADPKASSADAEPVRHVLPD
jgi:hypothetical protein